jgi:DNA invertase Pin-like site-specific DNA recombinase
VFEDEGHSGVTLIRPALERLRDVVAGVGINLVLCYSPDRLARKFAYQAPADRGVRPRRHQGGVRQRPARRLA